MKIIAKNGAFFEFPEKRQGDRVAIRLPQLVDFTIWANQYFQLTSCVFISWNNHAGNAAQYLPEIEEGEEGEIFHDINLSKKYAGCSDYLIGSLLHELIHAKQFELNPADFLLYAAGKQTSEKIHSPEFWRMVEDAAQFFGVDASNIANKLVDTD